MIRFYHAVESLFAIVATAILFSACTKDDTDSRHSPDNTIGFAVSAKPASGITVQSVGDERIVRSCLPLAGGDRTLFLHVSEQKGIASASEAQIVSRGEPVTVATIADAGILGFNFKGDWTESLVPNFMHNVRVAKSSGWKTDYKYPNDNGRARFYAYSPYNCKGITLPSKSVAGNPVFGYTVPSSVAEQQDLMLAQSEDVLYKTQGGDVALAFKHALTAVKFVTGGDIAEGIIKSITLKNIYTHGNCSISGDVPVWSGWSGGSNITLTGIDKQIDGSPDAPITTDAQTFMMIPQTLPADAAVEVVMTVDGKEHALSGSIAGTIWKAGYTATYKLSSSGISGEPVFSVAEPDPFAHTGGTNIYKVLSYKLRSDGTKAPMQWSVTGYSTDGGATWSDKSPAWLTLSATRGTGGDGEISYNATAAPQQGMRHDAILYNAEPVAGVYDLSTNGGTAPMNTANCYVINAAGKYSLPLVYGNAIKDGVANPSSYTSSKPAGTKKTLFVFLNHLGNQITDPYIYNNAGCEPADAYLLWQDAMGVVANVALSTDHRSITFDVLRANICQANAVIAVRNAAGEIMWSWHLWITDYHLGEDVKAVANKQGKIYNFMPSNLGWCYTSKESDSYTARNVKVRMMQSGNKKLEQIITIRQLSYIEDSGLLGNCPYYQWGRKDPLLPGVDMDSNQNKLWFNAAGEGYDYLEVDGLGELDQSISGCIGNPTIFSTNIDMDGQYWNLFNMDINPDDESITTVKKTIYDPSPVGFCVPPKSAFNGFTEDRIDGGWRKGLYFFCNTGKPGDNFYCPAVGYRMNDGGTNIGTIVQIGTQSDYMTSTPNSKTSYRTFNFYDRGVFVAGILARGRASSIRCVQEE